MESAVESMHTGSQEAQVFGRNSRNGINPTADMEGHISLLESQQLGHLRWAAAYNTRVRLLRFLLGLV